MTRRNSIARSGLQSIVLATLLLLTAIAPTGFAQEVTAAITGKVTDSSGATIADAKVTATDTERGTVWHAVTNGDGVYTLSRVPVGVFTVKVEKQGFQAVQQSNITLELN